MPETFFLETPENFNFTRTVFSHGWCELLPFELDKENWRLSYVFNNSKIPVSATISETAGKLKIEISDGKINEEKIRRDVRHILRLDDDLSEFYKLTKKELAWISETNTGRMLRSPTVFEDLVKTVCTTNCSWALTKKMTTNLVEKLGTPTKNDKKAFPTAEQMASQSAEFYKNEIRAGYRAPYFAELAEKVAGGKINPESWLDSDLPTKELKREMKTIKGVGDYAAENLLKLVGRYDGLALDSWLRSQFYKKHNGETICDDKQIEKFYERFAHWRGLVMWCDMTERWHD
ncbi:MAG: DNA-3-methyladenine glycosylase family protein [Pyrinomonadaceae bacterium]